MSSNKNISRRIKKEILNNDCDYDTLYNELLMYPEEVLSGILNSYLYPVSYTHLTLPTT